MIIICIACGTFFEKPDSPLIVICPKCGEYVMLLEMRRRRDNSNRIFR